MNYRLLPPDEWYRLSALMPEEFLPSPDAARAAVAEDDDGKIQGVLFLQLQFHMEPLVLHSPAVNFKRLHQVLADAVDQYKGLTYYAFTPDEQIARMTELVGMTRLPYSVWSKEVV